MEQKKRKYPIVDIKIPKYYINPELLRIIAERRRKRKGLL